MHCFIKYKWSCRYLHYKYKPPEWFLCKENRWKYVPINASWKPYHCVLSIERFLWRGKPTWVTREQTLREAWLIDYGRHQTLRASNSILLRDSQQWTHVFAIFFGVITATAALKNALWLLSFLHFIQSIPTIVPIIIHTRQKRRVQQAEWKMRFVQGTI